MLNFMVNSQSVEAMLMRAQVAVGPASMAGWLAGPMQRIIIQRAEERFLGQGEDVSGGGWKNWEPLKASTIAFRANQGFGPAPINVRTGELEKYITQSTAEVAPTAIGATMRYPGGGVPPYPLSKKVKTAQAGHKATKRSGATPPRPVLGLAAVDLELALASLQTWVVGSITFGVKGGTE